MTRVNLRLKDNFNIPNLRKPSPVGRMRVFLAPIIAAIIPATAASIGSAALAAIGITTWASLISVVIVGSVMIGLTAWSMISAQKGKPGSGFGTGGGSFGGAKAVDTGGQLVNSRQAAKVLPIVYGVARSGGNRIFS